MKTRPSPQRIALLLLVAAFGTGCRGLQIRELERRCDGLEARLSAVEAKVDMLKK